MAKFISLYRRKKTYFFYLVIVTHYFDVVEKTVDTTQLKLFKSAVSQKIGNLTKKSLMSESKSPPVCGQ